MNFGTLAPRPVTTKSSEASVNETKTFIVSDVKANATMRHCLSPLVSSNIPSHCDNSMRQTWRHLKTSYERIDTVAQFALRSQLSSLRLRDVSNTERYLGEFNRACEQLTAARVAYSDANAVYQLLFGIPETGTWGMFMQITLAAISASAAQKPPIIVSPEEICMHILAESQHVATSTPPPGPGSEFANVAKEGDCQICKHCNNPLGVKCFNCGKSSHDTEYCFDVGGGMAGQCPEWMAQRDAS